MPDWTQVRAPHVFKAIEECDRLGAKDFLGKYGSKKARAYTLWHRGNEYDSNAILGAALLHATGRAATGDEFSGGEQAAAKVLTDLGFDVVAEEQPVVPTRARKAAPAKKRTTAPDPAKKRTTAADPAKKRTTAPDPVVRLCPRCHVAVPATGICDSCD